MVSPLPPTFQRIVAGDTLKIGGRRVEVLSGDGHAPEQGMRWGPGGKIFLGAGPGVGRNLPQARGGGVGPAVFPPVREPGRGAGEPPGGSGS